MHIAIFICSILTAWRWGDWKNWQKYHTTMLYVAVGNLLYNFIYHDHLLWELKPPLLLNNHTIAEMLYTFIIFPSTVLILLKNYPQKIINQNIRIVKFIFIYTIIEYALYKSNTIIYKHGWNFGYSIIWDCMMIPMWILHHKRPLISYTVSIVIVLIMVLFFPINIK